MEQDKLTHAERRHLEALAVAEQHHAIRSAQGQPADDEAVLATARKYNAWIAEPEPEPSVPDIGQQRVDHMAGRKKDVERPEPGEPHQI
jgi:hypothetical protein